MRGDPIREGALLEGVLAAEGLQVKAVAAAAGVDPAQLSRHLHGRQEMHVRHAIQYGRAIELALARTRTTRREVAR